MSARGTLRGALARASSPLLLVAPPRFRTRSRLALRRTRHGDPGFTPRERATSDALVDLLGERRGRKARRTSDCPGGGRGACRRSSRRGSQTRRRPRGGVLVRVIGKLGPPEQVVGAPSTSSGVLRDSRRREGAKERGAIASRARARSDAHVSPGPVGARSYGDRGGAHRDVGRMTRGPRCGDRSRLRWARWAPLGRCRSCARAEPPRTRSSRASRRGAC